MRTVQLSRILLLFTLIFTTSTLHAREYRIRSVPNVQLMDSTKYVSDPQAILSIIERNDLDEQLRYLRHSVGIETAVVVLPAIDEKEYTNARDFAFKLFNYWGLGNRIDNNGLLILLLTQEGKREIVFETGLGTEETLTDGLCKLIQTKRMIPYLKEDQFGAGLMAGVDEVIKVFEGTSELKESKTGSGKMKIPLIAYFIIGILTIVGVDVNRKRNIANSDNPYQAAAQHDFLKKGGCWLAVLFLPVYIIYAVINSMINKNGGAPINCENCGTEKSVKLLGKPEIKQEAIPGQDGMKEFTFECSKCGFNHIELVPYAYVKPTGDKNSDNTSSRSSRGGSWGGGSSGGGGASTKF